MNKENNSDRIVRTPLSKEYKVELVWYMAWCTGCGEYKRCLKVGIFYDEKKERTKYVCLHCMKESCNKVSRKLKGILRGIKTKRQIRGRWL